MADKVNWSNAVAGESQPVLEQTLDFIEKAPQKMGSAIIQALMQYAYVANKVIVLWGCENSTPGGGTYTISAGAVYYNGICYEVDAVTLTPVNSAVSNFIDTAATFDPIKMQPSGTPVSVHITTKVRIVDALSGSGIADYDNWIFLKKTYTTKTAANQTTTSTTMVDITGLSFTTPDDGISHNWQLLFKCYSACTTSNGDGTGHEIFNATDAAQLDYTEAYQDEASTTNDQRFPLTCVYTGPLPPNKLIKVRFKSLAGGSTDTKGNKLSIVQLD